MKFKMSKNKEATKYIKIYILLTIIFCFFLISAMIIQNNLYKKQVNNKIFELVGEIKEQYPDLDEEKIIEILNSDSNSKNGQEILKQYGITSDLSSILKIEKDQKISLIINIGIILLGFFLFILIFIIYLNKRQAKIDELGEYINEVARGNYLINIEEISEDELNSLKNSLYKITVMLKEEAKNKKAQNEAILTSVSDISHQLKTPLTSIQILLDNILESQDMDEETKKRFILEISRQIKSMNFLILALLKLSKLDAGVVEFENKEINLIELINDCLTKLEVLAEIKQINIIKQFNKNPIIIGDYNWNKEAILNIIKNAIEHSNENKKVIIKLEENSVYVSMEIIDEGEGIDEKELKNIFNRFYKTSNSNENSIGIGLALSKSIIEKQNGYIAVESKKGKGTTFIIKYLK